MARCDGAYSRPGKAADKPRPGARRIDHNWSANLAAIGDHTSDAAVLDTKAGHPGVGEKHAAEFRGGPHIPSGHLSRLQVNILGYVCRGANSNRFQEGHQLSRLRGGDEIDVHAQPLTALDVAPQLLLVVGSARNPQRSRLEIDQFFTGL